MFDLLAFLDFLNSREKAVLIWGVLIFGYATWKAEGIGQSLLGIVRSLLSPKLLFLFASAGLYVLILVLVAREAGFWHRGALKETLYWFAGSGVILVGNAVASTSADSAFFKQVIRQTLRFTLLLEFLVNLYALPLLAELFLVPFVAILVTIQVVPQYSEPESATLRKVTERTLIGIGLIFLAIAAIQALSDLDSFLTRENAEDLLVPPALALALIPYLYAVAWLAQRELAHIRRRARGV